MREREDTFYDDRTNDLSWIMVLSKLEIVLRDYWEKTSCAKHFLIFLQKTSADILEFFWEGQKVSDNKKSTIFNDFNTYCWDFDEIGSNLISKVKISDKFIERLKKLKLKFDYGKV